MFFSARQSEVVTKVLRRGQNVVIPMYCLSILLVPIAIIDPGGVWYPWLSLLILVLQLPGLVSVIFFVRTDMVRLLVRQYEYWFFSAQNLLFSVCLFHLLGDLRVFVVPLGWLVHQNSILADAQVVQTKIVMYSAIIAYVISRYTVPIVLHSVGILTFFMFDFFVSGSRIGQQPHPLGEPALTNSSPSSRGVEMSSSAGTEQHKSTLQQHLAAIRRRHRWKQFVELMELEHGIEMRSIVDAREERIVLWEQNILETFGRNGW
ncbi:hypothetical protein FI667_g17224, partial [Globisporangium splendens]